MLIANELTELVQGGRQILPASPGQRGNPKLGVLGQLPGKWTNEGALAGHAWNLIALPFGRPGQFGDFRLLLNQLNEELSFDLVDLGVPNRGSNRQDQHIAALVYHQTLSQVAGLDAASNLAGQVIVPATPDNNDTPKGATLHPGPGVPPNTPVGIHNEPGLFMHLANLVGPPTNQSQPGPDLARLASIPHGDSVLMMGFSGTASTPGAPNFNDPALIGRFGALPVGLGTTDINNPYFGPYKHFLTAPFLNLFDPTTPLSLLGAAITSAFPGANVLRTTTISLDTKTVAGGIQNIPFVTAQASATAANAVFWIQEVDVGGGHIRFFLQYAQKVLLEFFPRGDGQPGLIQWPHISINTMVRSLP